MAKRKSVLPSGAEVELPDDLPTDAGVQPVVVTDPVLIADAMADTVDLAVLRRTRVQLVRKNGMTRYLEHAPPYPRRLVVGDSAYEREGADADGFEVYREPAF